MVSTLVVLVCEFFKNCNQEPSIGNQVDFFMHFLVMSGNKWLGWTCFLLVLYGSEFMTDTIAKGDIAEKHFIARKFIIYVKMIPKSE